jgi:putative DNA primase/helicase
MSDTPATAPQPQPRDLILQSCAALFAPDQVTELRVLGVDSREDKKAAGWFNDWNKLADHALKYERRNPYGIYVIVNQLHPGCLARLGNSMKDWVKTMSSDRDITRRNWLLIDLDTDRPSNVSSTDAELHVAIDRAKAIIAWLEGELGFQPGIRAHSGNGIHLMYRVDLPNNDANKDLLRDCIVAVSNKFGGNGIIIDKTVFNAARIWKLYGTIARKGENTTDRPHRRSCLWKTKGEFPTFDKLGIVPAEALEQLAALGRSLATPSPPAASATKKRARGASKGGRKPTASPGEFYIDLDGFIAEHGIQVTREETFDSTGKRYILGACLFDSSHTGTSACLGRSKTGRVFYKCQHDSCSEKGWQEVKALFGGKVPTTGTAGKPGKSDEAELAMMDLADEAITELFSGHPEGPTVRYWQQDWYSWLGSHYRKIDTEAFEDRIHLWLADKVADVKIRTTKEVVACLRAKLRLDRATNPPEWLTEPHEPDPCNLVVAQNGVLDLAAAASGQAPLAPYTPRLFCLNCVPYEYQPAAECPQWHDFVSDVMEEDEERVRLLAQWFGYCLTASTRLQAVMLFVGAPRSGKGTTIRVLQQLVGLANVTNPQLSDLGTEFGSWNLVGKRLAVFPDAHVPSGAVALKILEKLKSISGEDRININRKQLQPLEVQLGVRCLIATNELPKFSDQAKALKTRLLIVPFQKSYTGFEDRELGGRLCGELPGIFNWSVRGLADLTAHGDFATSQAGERLRQEFGEVSSPASEFLDEVFDVDEGNEDYTARRDEVWRIWKEWCQKNGHAAGSRSRLGVYLRAVLPNLRDCRTKIGIVRDRVYVGIRVKDGLLQLPYN